MQSPIFKKIFSLIFVATFLLFYPPVVFAADASCDVQDKLCLMGEIKKTADKIDNDSWRDKAYRELAKSYAYEGHVDEAIALIPEIKTPDTQAMTIRGIGMAAADSKWQDKARYDALFRKLTAAAQQITHPPSYAIAYTYIAMAQAFAGDDAGATKTAQSMENEALRNKAFAETAEIQAERGDYVAAMASIKEINSLSFRNKAYTIVAAIFTKQGDLDNAYRSAQNIENTYKRTQILQDIVNYGNVEETLPQ